MKNNNWRRRKIQNIAFGANVIISIFGENMWN